MPASKAEIAPGPPSAWGQYVLGRRIGKGGMGVVHAAIQRRGEDIGGIARLVAIKILLADRANDGAEREAFLREARILARLDHPNVVRWLDAGEVQGDVFIAMELLHGAALSQIVAAAKEPLPLPIALAILADLARGMHAAHELTDESGQPLGLVHQDISPQNAVVGYDGRTRLVDFGVARLASVDASRTDTVRGKPAYLAPEQLEGRRLDRRTDVFALGVVAFEILANQRLFARASIAETHTAVLFEPIPDLARVRPELSADLASVVACALSRPPNGRFRTAEAFRRALLEAQGAAAIPLADEREIAAFVSARVPPAWKPHELFAEIDSDGALAGDRPKPERAPPEELSQAATVAPRRARDPSENEAFQDAPTAAPRGARDPSENEAFQDAPMAAPRGARDPSENEAFQDAPMAAPRGAPTAPEISQAVPSQPRREQTVPAPHIPAAPPPEEPIERPPMSPISWWSRGAVLVLGAIALLGIVLGRSGLMDPAPLNSAHSGTEAASAPLARPEPPSGEPRPPSSATALATAAPRPSSGKPAGLAASAPASAAQPSSSMPVVVASPELPAPGSEAQPAVAPASSSAAAAPTNGWISVWSTPWGHVRIDGHEVGDSPAVRIAAPPGPHNVSVKSESGEQARGVTVKAGEESKVRFVF